MDPVIRVGLGYDLHRLEAGRKLILAGIEVPYEKGLAGHSDADVCLHAIIDALLGAAGLSDIGEQFPDTDAAYKDIDSAMLVVRTMKKINTHGYKVINVDATVICQAPKLSPFKNDMSCRVADLLDIAPSAVSIKAKTDEGVGAVGASQAIACHVVVALGAKKVTV